MKSIIFDFNGTLFQDTKLHYRAWKVFCEEHGIPFTSERFYTIMCGPANSEILRVLLGDGPSDSEIDAMSEEKEAVYRRFALEAGGEALFTPGAVEMLDGLSARGVPFALATASIRSNVDFYMNELNIRRWFSDDRVFYADGKVPCKPDPAIYRLTMEKLGYAPENTIVVEDGAAGIKSAVGAGVSHIIAIDTTLGPDAFAEYPQVRRVIHDFHGFERLLGELNHGEL